MNSTRRQPSPSPVRTPLAKRRRHSARLALYVSLALVGVLLAATYAWIQPRFDFGMDTGWAYVDWESFEEVQLLQEYVRIDTSMPPAGDPKAGARWLAEQLRAMGLEPVVEEVGDEANVWAVLEGEERGAVVLHSHLDVDEVIHPERWMHPPFSGAIDGPWIFGRGAFDMKSVTIAQLFALRHLVDRGVRPRKSVIFLVTTDEEHGSNLGTKWILRHHPELVERFEVVLTEGGAVEGRSMEELKYWGTEFVQRRLLDIALCGPRERLAALAAEMKEASGILAGEPKLVPEVERFLDTYSATRDAERLSDLLSEPRELVRDRAAFEGLPRYLKSFFRNELLAGDYAVEGANGRLELRAVLLPGEEPASALEELLPAWRRHGLSVAILDEGGAPHGTPPEHWAFQSLDRLMRRERPEIPHGPMVLTLTVTDARFFRNAGIPTYGYSPFAILTPDVIQLRQYGTINERMSLVGYVEGVEIYGKVVAVLAEGGGGDA